LSASRTGVRETPSCPASSTSWIGAPAASVPSTIRSRTRAVTSSCSDARRIGPIGSAAEAEGGAEAAGGDSMGGSGEWSLTMTNGKSASL